MLSVRGMETGSKRGVTVFPDRCFKIVSTMLIFQERFVCSVRCKVCFVVPVSLCNVFTELWFGRKRERERDLWFNYL